jgi:hypothetical protein
LSFWQASADVGGNFIGAQARRVIENLRSHHEFVRFRAFNKCHERPPNRVLEPNIHNGTFDPTPGIARTCWPGSAGRPPLAAGSGSEYFRGRALQDCNDALLFLGLAIALVGERQLEIASGTHQFF